MLDLPGERRVSVVDVPGHEGLVRTMVAGATGLDLMLLVVAADEVDPVIQALTSAGETAWHIGQIEAGHRDAADVVLV